MTLSSTRIILKCKCFPKPSKDAKTYEITVSYRCSPDSRKVFSFDFSELKDDGNYETCHFEMASQIERIKYLINRELDSIPLEERADRNLSYSYTYDEDVVSVFVKDFTDETVEKMIKGLSAE